MFDFGIEFAHYERIEKRWIKYPQSCQNTSNNASKLVADKDRRDQKRSRRDLTKSDTVGKLLETEPMVGKNNLLLQERHDGHAVAKGDSSHFEHQKQ